MSPKLRVRLGYGLAVVASLLLAASALDKISGSAHSLEMTASFGIAPTTYRLLGVVELASAVLFLVPRTARVGLLLLASYLGGAIATHLQHGQSVAFPAAIEAWIWIAAYVRFQDAFGSKQLLTRGAD